MSHATSQTPANPVADMVGHRGPPRPGRRLAVAASANGAADNERSRESRWRQVPEQLQDPYATPPTWDHLCVAERTASRFVISCKQCRRQLMTVIHVTDPDIAQLEAHIRACVRPDPLGEAPPLGAIMAQICVTAGDA